MDKLPTAHIKLRRYIDGVLVNEEFDIISKGEIPTFAGLVCFTRTDLSTLMIRVEDVIQIEAAMNAPE